MGAVVAEDTNIEAQCAAKGMRMTEQRRVIARVLSGASDHPDVEELHRRCAEIELAHFNLHGLPHGQPVRRRRHHRTA